MQMTVTPCAIRPGDGRTCYEPAHVVLFASVDGPVGGVMYAKGDRVLACLEHGGQLYDAMRTHHTKWVRWLAADPWITLPAVRAAHHETPATSPTRPRAWPARPSKYATPKR